MISIANALQLPTVIVAAVPADVDVDAGIAIEI